METWKPVCSKPGILASSLGRVVTAPRYAPIPNGGYRAYLPKPTYGYVARAKKDAKHSYRSIATKDFGTQKVHQLVCEAFHGGKPFDGAVVIHIDENGLNNRPENLKWGTQKENLNAPGFVAYCRSPERIARIMDAKRLKRAA